MNDRELVDAFLQGWQSTRGETRAIVECLTDEQFQIRPPGAAWKPLYWQFGCIGRTQQVYTRALVTGRLDFAFFASPTIPAHDTFVTGGEIARFLDESEQEWIEAIRRRRQDERYTVQWPEKDVPLVWHIAALQEHERLHHGQFIAYFTLAGLELPEPFRANWGL